MKTYHYDSVYIMDELPLLDGFALYSYSQAADPINRFSGIVLENSYAEQEANKLLDELKTYNNISD